MSPYPDRAAGGSASPHLFPVSNHKLQPLNQPFMLHLCSHDIDTRRIDAAVPQDIRQLYDVLSHAVKGTRKQLPQIMRKHLAGLYPRLPADPFHLRPDTAAV